MGKKPRSVRSVGRCILFSFRGATLDPVPGSSLSCGQEVEPGRAYQSRAERNGRVLKSNGVFFPV